MEKLTIAVTGLLANDLRLNSVTCVGNNFEKYADNGCILHESDKSGAVDEAYELPSKISIKDNILKGNYAIKFHIEIQWDICTKAKFSITEAGRQTFSMSGVYLL